LPPNNGQGAVPSVVHGRARVNRDRERLATPPPPGIRVHTRRFGGLGLTSVCPGDQPEAPEAGPWRTPDAALDPGGAAKASPTHPSDGNSRNWLRPKYPTQPRSSGFRSVIIRSRFTPRLRPVRCRTRSLNRGSLVGDATAWLALSSVNVNPRKERCHE